MGVAESSIEILLAKQAITENLLRYCRAMDRMDDELGRSCYHADSVDQHSLMYSGPGHGWIDWVHAFHEPMDVTRHTISNVLIEVDGQQAWSESYWTLQLRFTSASGPADFIGGGRWLDHHVKADGAWAIKHRRTTNDWDRVELVRGTAADFEGGPALEIDMSIPAFIATRDRSDPSYDFLAGRRTDFG